MAAGSIGGGGISGTPVVPGVGNTPGNANGVPGQNPTTTDAAYYAQNQQTDANGAQAQTGTQDQMNQYTAGQQGLQATLPATLQGVLNGSSQVPSTFTAPQVAFDAYNHNFNNNLAPKYAATYGSGGPEALSAQSLGDEQLAAQLYQTGQGNYLDYLNSANSLAFTPVGTQQANAQNQNWQQQGSQDTLGYQGPSPIAAGGTSILASLLAALGLR